MKHLLISILLICTPLAAGQLGDGWGIQAGGISGGGTMQGPLAWNVCGQVIDDTTPAMGTIPGGCNVLETSASNTVPTALTTIDGPILPGMIIWLIGGGGANPTTVADAGNFNLEVAWTGAVDRVLVLYVQAVDDFVEIGRAGGLRVLDSLTVEGTIALQNGETITNAVDGKIVLTGVGATNNEDLAWDFETVADTVGVSSSTGVADIEYGAIDLNCGELDVDGSIVLQNRETVTNAVDGKVLLTGVGGSNNEDAQFDLETSSNQVLVGTNTGVTVWDWGAIGGAFGSLDCSDGNISNVGDIALDSITAESSAIAVTTASNGNFSLDTNGYGLALFDLALGASAMLVGEATPVGSHTACTVGAAAAIIQHVDIDTSSVVGDLVHILSGTGVTVGFYQVIAVGADQVTVDRNVSGAGGADIAVVVYQDGVFFSANDGTNGNWIRGFSHQDKPLQIGGQYYVATASSLTSEDVLIGDGLEVTGQTHLNDKTLMDVAMVAPTGDEYARKMTCTVNKATSGTTYCDYVNMVDTASPGTAYLTWLGVGGSRKFSVTNAGSVYSADAVVANTFQAAVVVRTPSLTSLSNADINVTPHGTGDIILSTTGGPLLVGTAAFAPGHAPTGLYVQGSVEVDGAAYFDSTTTIGGSLSVNGANQLLYIGAATRGIGGALSYQTGGAMVFFHDKNNFIFAPGTGNPWLKDYDHATGSDSTIILPSATNPDADNRPYLALTHDQTASEFRTGTGYHYFTAAVLAANGTITLSANMATNDAFTLGAGAGTQFVADTDFSVGINAAATVANIVTAVNGSGEGAVLTVHANGDTVVIEHDTPGAAGNAAILTEDVDPGGNFSVTGAGTLTGGRDAVTGTPGHNPTSYFPGITETDGLAYFDDGIQVATYTKHHDINAGALAVVGVGAPGLACCGSFCGPKLDNVNEILYATVEIPEEWVGTSNMTLHIHTVPTDSDPFANGEDVDIDASWRSIAITETGKTGAAATDSVTYLQSGAGAECEVNVLSITVPYTGGNQPLIAEDDLGIQFFRNTATEASSYSGALIIYKAELIYEANAMPTH